MKLYLRFEIRVDQSGWYWFWVDYRHLICYDICNGWKGKGMICL